MVRVISAILFFAVLTGSLYLTSFISSSHAGFAEPAGSPEVMGAQSNSVGGSLLLAGACTTVDTNVPGANTSMAVVATPVSNPGAGAIWYAYVSAVNVVTVKVCGLIAVTPSAQVYNLKIIF